MPGELPLTTYLVEAAAGITVAILTGVTTWLARGQRDRKRVGEAPFKYVRRLDELIARAVREGPDHAPLNARAIVAARNSLVASSVGITMNLNSEIDRLARIVGEPSLRPARFGHSESEEVDSSYIDSDKAWSSIQVLDRIWPAKRTEVVVQVQRLLSDLSIPFDTSHMDTVDKWEWANRSKDVR